MLKAYEKKRTNPWFEWNLDAMLWNESTPLHTAVELVYIRGLCGGEGLVAPPYSILNLRVTLSTSATTTQQRY